MDIAGRTVLITGANRGIGRHLVDAFLAAGAARVLAGARSPESVDSADDRVLAVRLDVTDQTQIDAVSAEFADVSIVVNNAGMGGPSDLMAAPESAAAMMAVNVFGPWNVNRSFAPTLARNGGGAIVNILSVASWWSMAVSPGYSASKAAAWSVTNATRQRLATQGTHVLAVHCGYVDTEFSAWTKAPKLTAAEVADRTVEALRADRDEALLDDFTEAIHRSLAGPVAERQALRPDDFPARAAEPAASAEPAEPAESA